MVLYKRYRHRMRLKGKENISWLYIYEKWKNYKGGMKTKDNSVLQETTHVSKPGIAKCEVKKQEYATKKRNSEEETRSMSYQNLWKKWVNYIIKV